MDEIAVVAAMIRDRSIRFPASELDASDETHESVRSLEESGVLEVWEDSLARGRVTITFTPLAVERHRLRPDRDGLRWLVGRDDRRPDRPTAGREVLETDLAGPCRAGNGRAVALLDKMPDPRAVEPCAAAQAIELVAAWASARELVGRRRAILQRFGRRHPNCAPPVKEPFQHPPVGLLGVPPWPLPGQVLHPGGKPALIRGAPARPDSKCWACHGNRLPSWVECDACDRSGIDHLLPRVRMPKIVAPAVVGPKLDGGTGAARVAGGAGKGRAKPRNPAKRRAS